MREIKPSEFLQGMSEVTIASPVVREPTRTIRSYSGEHVTHVHAYAQIMFSLNGRMNLEVEGKQFYSDTSCGLIVPAGVSHGFSAPRDVRMLVIDAPDHSGLDRVRRFAVTPKIRTLKGADAALLDVDDLFRAPRILARRDLNLDQLTQEIKGSLHASWTTARMANMFFLSSQRFHARLIEITGQTPQSFLRELRLDRATELLRIGLSLETVALSVGYNSASALAFALRRDRNIGARLLRRGRKS